MQVKIICSDEEVAFEGHMQAESHLEIIQYAKEEAKRRDMPIQLEIYGKGVWSITPDGRTMRGALFHYRPGKRR